MTSVLLSMTPEVMRANIELEDTTIFDALIPRLREEIQGAINSTSKDDWLRWFRNSNWFRASIQDMLRESTDPTFLTELIQNSYSVDAIIAGLDLEILANRVASSYPVQQQMQRLMNDYTTSGQFLNELRIKQEQMATSFANDIVERVLKILSDKLTSSLDV